MKIVEIKMVLILQDDAKPENWLPDTVENLLEPGEKLENITFQPLAKPIGA